MAKKRKKKYVSRLSPYEKKIVKGYEKIREREVKEKYKKLSEDDIKRRAKIIKLKTKLQKVGARVEKALQKKAVSKKILKPSKEVTLRIKTQTPVEQGSHFFKTEWEEAKKQLFFK